MSAVNWLVSQPWPVFLAIWLPSLTVFGGVLLALFARPPRRKPRMREVSNWHVHTRDCPGRDKCICETGVIYPCAAHKGQADAALHSRQEAP